MGFFKFVKSQLLKTVEWHDESKSQLVYRFPMNGRQLMTGSKLTVSEGQVAIFVHKGKIADIFLPGYYNLRTQILPVLSNLLGWAYGFKSPFYCDVYFVSTKQFTGQKWGTSNPITMRDKDFGTIRIKAFGTYAFKVNSAEIFLKELFGTNSTFETTDINQYIKSMLIAGVSDSIAESRLGALDLAANLLEFNTIVTEQIAHMLENIGLKLTNLVIENVSFPEEVEKAIDTRSSMGVLGEKMDDFVKFQAAHAMRDAAKNEGGSNLVGTGVGIGVGANIGAVMSEALKPKKSESAEVKTCSKCGATNKKTARFCCECGEKLSAKKFCPSCGAEVKSSAKFCGECGAKV